MITSHEPFTIIPLTKGMTCLVDPRDYDWAMQWKWFCTWSLKNKQPKGYAARSVTIDGKKGLLWLHKEILIRHIGPHPPRHHIGDHRDGDSLNNRLLNLRWATFKMNAKNKYGACALQIEMEF